MLIITLKKSFVHREKYIFANLRGDFSRLSALYQNALCLYTANSADFTKTLRLRYSILIARIYRLRYNVVDEKTRRKKFYEKDSYHNFSRSYGLCNGLYVCGLQQLVRFR